MKIASLAMLNETFSVIFKYCDYGRDFLNTFHVKVSSKSVKGFWRHNRIHEYRNTKCNLWTLRKLEKLLEINWLSHLCIVNINKSCLHKGIYLRHFCFKGQSGSYVFCTTFPKVYIPQRDSYQIFGLKIRFWLNLPIWLFEFWR